MSRFNTGNPLGSSDPRDLDDNAKNMDLAVNSEDSQWIDRFGRPRLPLMEQERQFVADQVRREDEFQDSQDDRDDEFDASQASRETRFNNFIASSGYQFVGDYGPGIEITEYNQLIRDSNGEFWRVSGQVDLPYVTTGAGLPEDDAFVPAGDAVLRQELANPLIGTSLIAGATRNAFQFGAVGDGVTDDTAALQAFLDAGGGTLTYTAGGYLYSERLYINNPCTLVGIGGMPKLYQKDQSDGGGVHAQNCTDVIIMNIEIDGNEGQQESQSTATVVTGGLMAVNVQNLLIANCSIHDTVGGSVFLDHCKYFHIQNVYCGASPSDGLKIMTSSHGTVRNVVAENHPKSLIHAPYGQVGCVEIEDGSHHITLENITCRNTDKQGASGLNIATHAGEPITHSITVKNLRTEGMYDGVRIQNQSRDIRIENHVSIGERNGLLLGTGSSNVVLDGFRYEMDEMFNPTNNYSIYINGQAKNIRISNGEVTTAQYGLYITSSDTDIEFDNCKIFGRWTGLRLDLIAGEGSAHLKFRDCVFTGEQNNGVFRLEGTRTEDISVDFDHCRFVDTGTNFSGDVIDVYIPNVTFQDCEMDFGEKAGIEVFGSAKNCSLLDCRMKAAGGGTKAFVKLLSGVENFTLRGCTVDVPYSHGIYMTGSEEEPLKNIRISDNTFKNVANGVFRFYGDSATRTLDYMRLQDNDFINCRPFWSSGYGPGATNVTLSGNNPEIASFN